jgi:hypothetical protein
MPEALPQSEAHVRLRQRWEALGFDALSQAEQEAVALYWLEGEVMNGGLHQYFYNSSGDMAELALAGLARLGATESLAHFRSAIDKLGAGEFIANRDARYARLVALGMSENPFDSETRALQDLPENFFELALFDLAARYGSGNV